MGSGNGRERKREGKREGGRERERESDREGGGRDLLVLEWAERERAGEAEAPLMKRGEAGLRGQGQWGPPWPPQARADPGARGRALHAAH